MFIINGEVWRVLLVPPTHPFLYRNDGSLSIGACDDYTKTIYINQNLSAPLTRKVLCHEITHAAMFSYNVQLTIDQEELLSDLIASYGQEIISITNEIFSKIKWGNSY